MPNAQPPVWPLYNLVIFDCDSTLSAIEGIDELARLTGHEHDVAALTKRAMEGDIPLEAVYGHRLVVTSPTQAQVQHIARIYRDTVIQNAREVIEALQALGSAVFIVSGGLIEPVRDFGVWLGVPREHIFAVNMEYDQLSGQWWRYWEQSERRYMAYEPSPLAGTRGKNQVVQRLRRQHPGRALLIGDGGSDLEVAPDVDLFVGFGGAVKRQRVLAESPVYIHCADLSPVLPLALGRLGNTPRTLRLWAEGLQRVYQGEVTFRDPTQQDAFLTAMQRGMQTNTR
mgnify:CR=1 FL=1